MVNKHWSLEEEDILIALWGSKTADELTYLLPGRTIDGIKVHAKRLGLKRSREFTAELKSRNMRGEKNPMYGKPGVFLGKSLSAGTRKKISDSRKGSVGLCGNKNPRYGKPGTMLGKKASPETCKKISLGKKRFYQALSEEEKAVFDEQLHKARTVQNSKKETLPEKKVRIILDNLGVEYIFQAEVGYYLCDFWLPMGKILEVHGDYWHANPHKYPSFERLNNTQKKNVYRDRAKLSYLTNRGFKVLILWENELKRLDLCKEKIKDFVDNWFSA